MPNIKTKALICGFIISVMCSFIGFFSKCDSISEKIFRLHIIANSNSDADQNLKLKVRDRVLRDFGNFFAETNNLNSVKNLTEENIYKIENVVKNEIESHGYSYPVKVTVTKCYFNNRKYNHVTLPAGIYNALKITIGKGEGKNWWCVMFPPMCLPSACEEKELSEVLDDSELFITTNESKYEIKFKVREIFTEIKESADSAVEKFKHFLSSKSLNYNIDFKMFSL